MMDGRLERSALDADEADALQSLGWRPREDGSACPDSALLLAAEEGVLEDAAMGARIRAHVEGCPTCRVLIVDLASVLAEAPTEGESARIRQRIAASRQPPRRPALWWLASAGLAAAALIAGIAVVPWRTWLATDPPVIPDPNPTVVAPLPTMFKVGRPAIPRPEPQLTLRGEAAPVPVNEQIGQALDDADAGDMAGAISKLTAIVQANPASADAHLALGATLLRADRVGESLQLLERAKLLAGRSAGSIDEFEWHLAIAFVRSKDDRATEVLESLCSRNTERGALACKGLAEIRRIPR